MTTFLLQLIVANTTKILCYEPFTLLYVEVSLEMLSANITSRHAVHRALYKKIVLLWKHFLCNFIYVTISLARKLFFLFTQ